MNNCYYEINNKGRIIKIFDIALFNEFLVKNDGEAPPIPANAKSISENIFKNIYNIKRIYIPYSVNVLPNNLFFNNRDVIINYADYYEIIVREITPDKKYELNYKLKNIKDLNLFNKYCEENDGRNPNVPQGVTSISDFVFKDNNKIKILKLPETTICLCKQCCKNCINLEKVYLSKKILDFGEEVFYGCTSLSGIFNIPKSLCILRANVFKNCNDNLKIKIFGKYISSLNNFLLKGDLKDLPNIVNQNIKAASKSLITNNYIYVLRDNKCYKITKKMYSHLLGYDKNTGENKILIREIFYHNKGIKLLMFIENCNKYNIKLPMEKIICNTPDDKIEYFCKEYNSFCKKIIKEVRNISTYKTKNDKGELVGRLTKKQYYIIYVLLFISGYFENENLKPKCFNLLINNIFNINSKKNINNKMSLEEFEDIFEGLLYVEDIKYNQEFATYFLFDKNNLKKLIKELKLKPNRCDFLKLLIENSGYSNYQYNHDGMYEQSKGKLHDKWLIYKANNNNKEKNIGIKKEKKVLDFIDWACKYGDGSYILNNYELSKEDYNDIYSFLKYYTELKPIKKLIEIFDLSKNIIDYIFLNNYDNYIDKSTKKLNISKVDSAINVFRTFEINYIKCGCGIEVSKIIKSLEKKLITKKYNKIYAKIMPKSSKLVALSNCKMGHCANVKANGIEYLFESYIDCNTQPFIIFNSINDEAIANFRITLNSKTGIGHITCLEVDTDVKFNYIDDEKKDIVSAFYNIISNFIDIYNSINDNKIKLITMGQISHYDINDILSKYFPILDYPISCNDNRRVVMPSEYNHFLIWNNSKNKLEGDKND